MLSQRRGYFVENLQFTGLFYTVTYVTTEWQIWLTDLVSSACDGSRIPYFVKPNRNYNNKNRGSLVV